MHFPAFFFDSFSVLQQKMANFHLNMLSRMSTSLRAICSVLVLVCVVRYGIYLVMIAASAEAQWLIEARQRYTPSFKGAGPVAMRFITRDPQQYIEIALSGYETDNRESARRTAFFPLWPGVIRPIVLNLPGNWAAWAVVIVANALAVVGSMVLFVITRDRYGESCAVMTLIVLNSLPSSFFLYLPFSEPLFLCLFCILLWSIDRMQIAVACAVCLLLPMSRPIGALVFLGVLYWNWSRCSGATRYFPSVCVCLGYTAYLGIMYWFTGNPFQGFDAQ